MPLLPGSADELPKIWLYDHDRRDVGAVVADLLGEGDDVLDSDEGFVDEGQ